MLAAERRDLLLTRLRVDGKVVAKELAAELGLSEDSIRRDLRELAAAGLCQKVYGGAVPASPALADYTTRAGVEPAGKTAVAVTAAALIRPGSVVILDGGTTTLAVTRALPTDLECTVVTHSPTVAVALLDHPGVEVVLLGGRLFKHSMVTCGAVAAEAAAGVTADLFLLGVTGVHPVHGLTTGDVDEAAMKRLLASRSAETWVLASAEKLGAASRYTVLPLAEVSGVVTDGRPHETVDALRNLGVTVREGRGPRAR
ncbi:DeoR/GlpR transcriptional regulator [Nakamurella flavida]|uniref:Lactose phosphotransferase system repressor n=1 Tax=Nakamurella flavida TaxID=363630 RepID=A0A939C0F8_9ACTN|nr:DeoR/GlpR family DNA-binding transcription regulator [Nakamurella flavida]MBM9476668.1 DeoR/GlpR transcriptional regulator [Nakamurella flavida]MDP9778894.1 DeoR/GlpR family transcriptional regulator of sugar metabolism [Nakamurella flavida]